MTMSRRTALRSLAGIAGAFACGVDGLKTVAAATVHPRRDARMLDPFEIAFEPSVIEDLHRRIDGMRWPEIPFDTGWTAGTNDRVLRDLVAYWRNEYDWFGVQAELNELDHRRRNVAGEALHYVAYEGTGDGPRTPLLLLHGWPSSFVEFLDAAPLLAQGFDGAAGFDLVVPSLPGFAFSDVPRSAGMNAGEMADRLHLLMETLGHSRYGIQGGDWGAIIGSEMARRRPEAVTGLHVSFVASAPPPPTGVEPSEEEEAYRRARERFQADETGYSSIQTTRPQSLAYAQEDSPVGWLAWMLEKFWAWSDHEGDLWATFERDRVLTNAMVYWLPRRILSSARVYHETLYRAPSGLSGGRVEVPTGYARYPAEPWAPPREVVERTYDLVHYAEPERGGHFPALEQPGPWARDVSAFFNRL